MATQYGEDPGGVADSSAVLARYEQLLHYTQSMLSHAREGSWLELLDFESRYVVAVEALAREERGLSLSREEGEHKADLLAAILQQVQGVRELLIARRDELGALIQTQRQRQNLHRSYGANSSPVATLRGAGRR